MATERIRRQIDRLFDEAEQALVQRDWDSVLERSQDVLRLDPDNADAQAFLSAAEREPQESTGTSLKTDQPTPPPSSSPLPTSFADGRYEVKRFLGEGGKKKVYLAHDTNLDRDVAFALIKTEGMDEISRTRVSREAQAMGRVGDHPNILPIYDFGEESGQPYLVLPFMTGGDVEGLIEDAPEHKVPLERAIEIAQEVCFGLGFLHSKGIVHRDLKPGNVLLTEGGTASICDFGLAVATDRSRITTEGMMVGTVSYMPPEQAMGGTVEARSDLYSLGAMLFEMVTGRPPFIGDESVAIITQHLNTPPVAPSWHNPECPTALEVLILRLLEKDPEKRPASADEVRQALESVDVGQGATSDTREKDPAQATISENPIYRRTFVGRESELRQMEAAFDSALSGEGSLIMVAGEPGIGKTSITEQIATYVSMRGGTTLFGHCYEEGSLTLPYLAFVEAMRSYVLTREPDGLKEDLGTGAAVVARIVSEIRDRVQVELTEPGDPDEERYRLMQSVTTFLRNASTVQPLMIVLEDLHDADSGTLDMLTHVARNLSGTRLLIVGTYRDVEVDRSHPLSSALAELRRGSAFTRIPLRGLTVDEVHRMWSNLEGSGARRQVSEAVFRQTEGNPLFIQEVFRYFVEEGMISRQGGRWVGRWRTTGEPATEFSVPEGLRDVIGKRLTKLSEECNGVLAIAAVVGREFRLDVLQQVAGLEEDALFTLLEEAKGVGVVEERTAAGAVVTYRFTHAFFRQTLYEETIAPRRIRMHQQVGAALESVHQRRLEDHSSEMAEHFSQSSVPEDLTKAVQYGEMAAQRALSVSGYGEAARLLGQAIQVQEVLDLEDKAKRCDLLLALGEALMPAGEPRRAYETVAPEAFSLAEEVGDSDRASLACRVAITGLLRYAAAVATLMPEWNRWAERADHHAGPGTVHRIHADIALAWAQRRAGHWVEAVGLLRPALELARQLDDNEALFHVASRTMAILYESTRDPRHAEEALGLAEEFSARAHTGVTARTLVSLLEASGRIFLKHGERARADEMWRQIQELALRTQDSWILLRSILTEVVSANIDGRLEDAVATAESLVTRGDELSHSVTARQMRIEFSSVSLVYLGRTQELLDYIDEWLQLSGMGDISGTGNDVLRPNEALIETYIGRNEQAQKVLSIFVARRQATSEQEYSLGRPSSLYLEMALQLEQKEAASIASKDLEGFSHLLGFSFESHARQLGAAALLLGDPNKARSYYEQAQELCGKIGHRPEIALTRLQLSELLLKHYPGERVDALEHLDFAIGEFRDMKMQPSLERALRHRDILKA